MGLDTFSSSSAPQSYLDDGLGEVHPSAQQAVEAVPLLLQRSQVCLQLILGLVIPHRKELPADVQSVNESGLIPLEEQLCVLRRKVNKGIAQNDAL